MADYKNPTDYLDYGRHIIEVHPKYEWSDKLTNPKTNQATGWWDKTKHKKAKSGSWIYTTRFGDDFLQIFATLEEKIFFDTGKVEVNIKKKFNADTGAEEKKYYFNPASEKKSEELDQKELADRVAKNSEEKIEERPDVDSIPF